jgi:predicted transcriptional regulator
MERDKAPVPKGKVPAVGRLSQPEACLIARRRAGKTLRNVAEALGLCVFTVRRMEQGEIDSTRLATHLGV